MRSAATVLMWLITTLLLAAAVPAVWAQQHLVDRDGYSALAQRAAADPELQAAMAGELTAQVGRLASGVDSSVVSRIAAAYTSGSAFPAQFAQANGFAHRWLFTTAIPSTLDPQGRWVIDLAPMLSDVAFVQTLNDYNVAVPDSLPIPLTDEAPAFLRPGALRAVGLWGPWISIGLAVLTGAAALLTLFAARSRGRALAALGVSGLLVGGAGWAAIEFAQRYLRDALNNTSGTARRVADVMVATAQDSMHQWLNVTLVVGGGLVIVGVIVSLLGGLARSA
ncbi:MAG: hypothetical protein O2892_08900 [Actinomycetota bacterium]|nr:hypothetical protein [Actinomycetota bacterium]MDA2949147.1 hypothetical protein [Actinomycetota bacterium]